MCHWCFAFFFSFLSSSFVALLLKKAKVICVLGYRYGRVGGGLSYPSLCFYLVIFKEISCIPIHSFFSQFEIQLNLAISNSKGLGLGLK